MRSDATLGRITSVQNSEGVGPAMQCIDRAASRRQSGPRDHGNPDQSQDQCEMALAKRSDRECRYPTGHQVSSIDLRIALAHEWLADRAGSEVLFERMAAVFPEADIFALTVSPEAQFDFGGRAVRSTFLDVSRHTRNRRDLTLPLMPLAWKALRRRSYDVVITSTHGFAREFHRQKDGLHLNYVHAPMRYAWSPELDQRAVTWGRGGRWAAAGLRALDRRSISKVDAFAANSTAVAQRIALFYGRTAEVIFPPVDIEYFAAVPRADAGYLLSASRFVPYKRHDLAIRVAARLNLPIVVAGSGPDEDRLRSLAAEVHPNGVTFAIQPDRPSLRNIMAGASAFIFPAHEDFGIIVPEVLATGTPVVGLAAGGSLDTVRHGKTGTLADEQSVIAFAEATAECLNLQVDPQACRDHARQFAADQFCENLAGWASRVIELNGGEEQLSLRQRSRTR